MAYQFERAEWRSAVRTLTEADRHATDSRRWAVGVIGDRSDDYPERQDDENGED